MALCSTLLEALTWPMDTRDARTLGRVLRRYSRNHYGAVVVLFCATYLYMQSFCVPGSISLSILSGFLFDIVTAVALVSLVRPISSGG